MRIKELLLRFISAALVCVMLFCNQPWTKVAAEEVQNHELATQYISDVKMFYGIDEKQARGFCEREGYIFCPQNLKEGTNTVLQAYLGYKVTEDPDDAVTDITLLDMKTSNYREMSYEEYLDKYIDEYADQAEQIMILVNEYRSKYAAGSTNALVAYDSLNMIYVDENKSHTDPSNLLGNYLLKNGDAAFFEKFIQRGNAIVYGSIANFLAIAAADNDHDGSTWVDKAKTSPVYELYVKGDSATRNQYNAWYGDSAKNLIKALTTFAETYREGKTLYDQYGETFGYELDDLDGDCTVADIMEKHPDCKIPEYLSYMELYELLDSIVYQEAGEEIVNDAALLYEEGEMDDEQAEGLVVTVTERQTLAEYFLSLADDPELSLYPQKVYPLLDGMTTAQRTVLNICGLNRLVKMLFVPEDYEAKRKGIIADNSKQLKEIGYEDGKIYLWACVDMSEYTKKVAETRDLIEAKNGGKDLIEDENARLRKETSNLTMALKIADIAILATMGVTMIVQAFVGSLWSAGVSFIAAAIIGPVFMASSLSLMAAIGSVALGIFLCALYVLNIIAFVASIVYMVYMIMDACGYFDPLERTDYSTAPDIVYHIASDMNGNYRIRYDAVSGNLADWFTETVAKHHKTFEELNRAVYSQQGLKILERFYHLDTSNYPMPEDPKRIEIFNSNMITLLFDCAFLYTEGCNKADLGAYLGSEDRWVMLYASKSRHAGKPIEVVPGESFLITQQDYLAPDEYRPVSLISGTQAVNVNDIKMKYDSGTKTPRYMFVTGAAEAMTSATITESEQYVTKVSLAHSDKRENALNILQKDGLEPIQTNLTPYDGFTYIGYQLGSESNAVTDLRVSTLGTDTIQYGSVQYGKAGLETSGTTPDGISLYATYNLEAGTPITKLTVETERLPLGCGAEPVCLFSGGQAVDFKHKWSDNAGYDPFTKYDSYFSVTYNIYMPYTNKTAQDDPVDGLYLYFWPKEQYFAPNDDSEPPYVAGFSYFMAANKGGDDKRFGTNEEFMKTFAKENGFELVEGCNTLSSSAGQLKVATRYQDKEGGALKDWTYDIYHTQYRGQTVNYSDGASIKANDALWLDRFMYDEPGTFNAQMYFGVSYTYNPYRAITGVNGLITSYTETTDTIRYKGLTTPAGTMLTTNVSIQGNPITAPGVSVSYYNMMNMTVPFYIPWDTRQNKNLDWMPEGETEVMTHYLLTAGPTKDVLPIKRDEIRLVYGQENPGQISGFVPVCDLRTPGDYDHPMNLALDTSNKGSEYLYLFVRKDAGGRAVRNDKDEIIGEDPKCSNEYTKKHYIAAVFCGTGKTPEAAICDLYFQATKQWPAISALFSDIPEHPLALEFDEIIPLDISADDPWYEMGVRDVSKYDPSDDHWVYGNDLAYKRWRHSTYSYYIKAEVNSSHMKPTDKTEGSFNCAYVGVVRTNENKQVNDGAVYSILKYYTDAASAPSTLKVGETGFINAGGPVNSKEGKYYLYYSRNIGTAAYSAPITEIDISKEMFINGYNTSFSCSESDRKDNKLPNYMNLRMRTDEKLYIHTKFDMDDLPYIECIYIGVGDTREQALSDMVGTTNANAATDVNCNYNSCTGKWLAIGYRRTSDNTNAIHDIFLYVGDDPPDKVNLTGGYAKKGSKYSVYTYKDVKLDEDGNEVKNAKGKTEYVTYTGVPYNLLKRNLTDGTAEAVSLNEGSGGPNIYLYYSMCNDYYYSQSADARIAPICNLAFTYGDISPKYATTEQLARVYQTSLHGQSSFMTAFYQNVHWENALAVISDAPDTYRIDGSVGSPLSLNYGVLPGYGNNYTQAPGDMRIRLYVDHGTSTNRSNTQLTDEGYYSETTTYGRLKIK